MTMLALIRSAAVFLSLLPALAFAQSSSFPQTLPANSVVGRLGINAGPTQAIPFVNFVTNLPLAQGKILIGSAGNFATPQTPSGDWTISNAGLATLATVNANVGTFGSATQCVTVTNNAKGLTTAVSAATCTPAIGSITGLGAGIAAALAANTGSPGAPVLFNGNGGTPSAIVLTNGTGTAAGLTAGNATLAATVTTNANLTGPVTSVGNATAIAANQITRTMEAQGVARSVVGVTGNATANVADIQGTANQFLGVNSAGTALAFNTMSQDCTLATGVITCTGINGVNQNAAWTIYTPTITSQGGTITAATIVATGRYKQIGKTVIAEMDITLTNIGTGAPIGSLQATLPLTAAAFRYAGSCYEYTATGKSGAGFVPPSGTFLSTRDATGTTWFTNGFTVVCVVTYEVP
ncbi:hypothetical protein [Bradyrhizobium sp. AZCC 2289]|uniref:hypothetical protein n=1 Tax=Bradyrhizobium sp. AZCC 2289 TaxID=3117026 RepID=UPI002FF38CF3